MCKIPKSNVLLSNCGRSTKEDENDDIIFLSSQVQVQAKGPILTH